MLHVRRAVRWMFVVNKENRIRIAYQQMEHATVNVHRRVCGMVIPALTASLDSGDFFAPFLVRVAATVLAVSTTGIVIVSRMTNAATGRSTIAPAVKVATSVWIVAPSTPK